jgi:HK97 family phage major capsid protein
MTIKEMIEKRARIAAEMQELAKQTPMTAETRTKFDALDAEQEGLKKDIDAVTRAAAVEAETRATTRPPEASINGDPTSEEERKKDEEKYRVAYRNYLKYGFTPTQYEPGVSDEHRSLLMKRRTNISPEVQEEVRKALSQYRGITGEGGPPFGAYPGSTTGQFVPVGFVNEIEEALKWYGGMWGQGPGDPTVMDTATGQPLPFPTDNDTAESGEWITENSVVTLTGDVSIGMQTFGAFKWSSKLVKVSLELLQDSAFDLETFLRKKFSIRMFRGTNLKFTTGAGTTEPQGIVTAATAGVTQSTNPAIVGDDNQTTPDPTQQFGWIDLNNLLHSVDPAYRKNAKYMLHDSSIRYAKTLKDKYGRLLWQPAVSAGNPDTVNGYGFVVNNDMATVGGTGSPNVGNKSVLFGALDKYQIRRVKDLSIIRLSERFAEYGQVAFLAFARFDGQLLDAGTHPVKYLQHHS